MAQLGTTNISTTLVRNTLGAGNNDVGTLCRSSLVNRFSRFKPIYHTSPFGLTDTDFLNAQYGIIINEMVAMNSNGAWSYSAPTSASPKRIGDFRKYYHDAPIPLLQVRGTSMVISPFYSSTIAAVGFQIPQAPSGMGAYCLTVADLAPNGGDGVLLDNFYLGAAVYNSGGTKVGEFYSVKTIKYSSGLGADMDGASIQMQGVINYATGNYSVHLFLTNSKTDIIGGGFQKFWPIYYRTGNPKVIPMTVKGLEDIYESSVTGIRPNGDGLWLDGTTGWKTGTITKEETNTIRVFDVRVVLKNVSGVSEPAMVTQNRLYIKYVELIDWSGSTDEKSTRYSIVANTISLGNGGSTELIFTGVRLAPATFPDIDDVYIPHQPGLHLVLDSGP
ncbi:MAG: hypothetical protein RBR82_17185, partial [Pseudomonas sp.]|nr:hypothetical protein [Pseudomonas sp.]